MGNGYTPDITPGGDRDRPKLGMPHLRLDGSRLTSLEQGGTRLSCVWAGLGLAVVSMGTAVFGAGHVTSLPLLCFLFLEIAWPICAEYQGCIEDRLGSG